MTSIPQGACYVVMRRPQEASTEALLMEVNEAEPVLSGPGGRRQRRDYKCSPSPTTRSAPQTRFQPRRPMPLRIEAEPGRDGIHGMRAVLKVLLRRHGLHCSEAREETTQ
jgi:hypothetical protein